MPTKGGIRKMINSNQIIYIKVHLTNSIIKFSDGHSLVMQLSLKQFEARLPPELFCRTHRNYIVCLDHVISVAESHIAVTAEKEGIPLSENYKKNFYSHFIVI
ncbi:LytTr DNA-binding domain-containing protein [Chitinophaga sp. CF418]|nr:LytTr DNA-binding domain-containing protein [Chitinophaga sp. CF418]